MWPIRGRQGRCRTLPVGKSELPRFYKSVLRPSRRDNGTGATPPGDGTPVHIDLPPQCRYGRQKGGGAPVHLRTPGSARRHRESSRNCDEISRLENFVCAHRKASFVHMPPFIPCALPDRHEAPLFTGQNQSPTSGLPTIPNGQSRRAAEAQTLSGGRCAAEVPIPHSFRVLMVTDLLPQNVPLENVQYWPPPLRSSTL